MEGLATRGLRRGRLRGKKVEEEEEEEEVRETSEKGQASFFACVNCVALSLQRVGASGCRHLSFSFFFFLDVL